MTRPTSTGFIKRLVQRPFFLFVVIPWVITAGLFAFAVGTAIGLGLTGT